MSCRWRVASLVVVLAGPGCSDRPPATTDALRLQGLRASHQRLHRQLETVLAQYPVATRAFADPGQIVVAIHSRWIEALMTRVARQYFDQVTLDLASVEASSTGRIDKDSVLGHFKVGDWRVDIVIDSLRGVLAAGPPRLAFRGPDLLEIALPVDVREALGQASIRFAWDSSSMTNAVCKDFELRRTLSGSVMSQTHEIKGALRLSSKEGSIVAVPLFPDRTLALRVTFPPESWSIVDSALRSQNSLGKCGLLLKPEVVVAKLHELAEGGIRVTLPASIFRTIRLPARIGRSVEIAVHKVGVEVSAERLWFDHQVLWSSASVRVSNEGQTGTP